MAKVGRYFATDNRSEKLSDLHPARRLREIDQKIVLCGNWQLKPFAGQGEHAFVECSVTMAGISESMDMCIASNPTQGWHLARNLHLHSFRFSNRKGFCTPIQSILETARGVDSVLGGKNPKARLSVSGVNDSWTDC